MAEKVKTVPVTRIKRLAEGQVPTFTMPVEFKRLDGTPVQVDLQCKALRKTAWSKLRDDVQRAALQAVKGNAAAPVPEPEAKTEDQPAADADLVDTAAPAPAPATAPATPYDFIEQAMTRITEQGLEAGVRKHLAADADLIMQFATGWDLEDDFTAASLVELEDECGGFLGAALNAYDRAIYHGRVGN